MPLQPGRTRHLSAAQRLLGAGLALLCGACQGQIVGAHGGGESRGDEGPGTICAREQCTDGPGTICVGDICTDDPNIDPTSEPVGPGEVPMRRLNNAEYANTLRDLFGNAGTTVAFPEEGRTQGFDTLNTALAVSPIHIEAYLDAASEVVTELFDSDPAGIRAGFCDYQSADDTANLACARQIVADFATLAWRRAHDAWRDAQPDSDHMALLEPTGALGQLPLETRLRTALEAVLVSSRFIYRVEFDDAAGNLDTPSLASRLSYFLWSSAPDAELLASDLGQHAVLEAQVSRLQESELFERFLERFSQMWLELEKLDGLERDAQEYPAFSPALAAEMGAETRQFFADYWWNPTATVTGFLLAPNPQPSDGPLADLYGDSPRFGVVTQASILTLTGAANRTSPVRRGKWVLERLLCDPPPPPPDGLIAELTAELEADDSLTERERLARHRVQPICAGCHSLMDPIGLGFENYDSLGAYRTVDGSGKPIDATGVLPGSDPGSALAFAGPQELIEILAQDERLQTCVARQLLTYGTGRTYGEQDEALLELVSVFAGGTAATFRSVLNGVVLSDAFRRRIEEVL